MLFRLFPLDLWNIKLSILSRYIWAFFTKTAAFKNQKSTWKGKKRDFSRCVWYKLSAGNYWYWLKEYRSWIYNHYTLEGKKCSCLTLKPVTSDPLLSLRPRHGREAFPGHLHLGQHHLQPPHPCGGEAPAPQPQVLPWLLPGLRGRGCGVGPSHPQPLLRRRGGAALQGRPPVPGPDGLEGVWAGGRQSVREGEKASQVRGQQLQPVQVPEPVV